MALRDLNGLEGVRMTSGNIRTKRGHIAGRGKTEIDGNPTGWQYKGGALVLEFGCYAKWRATQACVSGL